MLNFDLGLGCSKEGAPNYDSLAFSSTSSSTNHSTSFLGIPSLKFSNGYGLKHIIFASSFNSNSTGSVFQVTSVPLNNSLIL